jgi:hypothetical protein
VEFGWPTSLRTPDNLIERAKTFHPGMHRRQPRWADSDDDDFEDDDDDDEEYIDIEKLRSVLFGDKYATSKSGYDTPRTMTSYPSSVPSTSRRPSQLTHFCPLYEIIWCTKTCWPIERKFYS